MNPASNGLSSAATALTPGGTSRSSGCGFVCGRTFAASCSATHATASLLSTDQFSPRELLRFFAGKPLATALSNSAPVQPRNPQVCCLFISTLGRPDGRRECQPCER